MEDPRNIIMVCEKHAARPDPHWLAKPLKFFVGKYVKLGFDTDMGPAKKEHMWVAVTGIKARKFLVGTLDNDPICCSYLVDGTEIEFTRDEIEVVLHGSRILTHDD